MTTTTYVYSGPAFNYTYLGGPPNDGSNLTCTVTFDGDMSSATGWYGAATTQFQAPNLNNGGADPIDNIFMQSGTYSGFLSSSTVLNGGPVFYFQNGTITQWYVNFVSPTPYGLVNFFTENWPVYTEDSLFLGYPIGQSGAGEIAGIGKWTQTLTPPPELLGILAAGGSSSTTFYELGPAVQLTSSADVESVSGMIWGASVSVTSGTFANDLDVLNCNTSGTAITSSYDSTTETLTLSGVDTIAHYEQILDSVSFQTTSKDPTSGGADPTRTITWAVYDGTNVSAPVHTTVNVDILGLDTSDAISKKQAQAIKSAGYQFVGRYLDIKTRLSTTEVGYLSQAKLPIVSLYEDPTISYNAKSGNWQAVLDPGQAFQNGYNDASLAYNEATKLSQPFGSAIYFTIDINEPTALSGIELYFEGIEDFMQSKPSGSQYQVGVYGSSITVSDVMNLGLAKYSWLTTSWPDPMGLQQAEDWNIWQPNVNNHNLMWVGNTPPGGETKLSSVPGNLTIDTDYANSGPPAGAWIDPPNPTSTNGSSLTTPLLFQSEAGFGAPTSAMNSVSLSSGPDGGHLHSLIAS
jgi:hypothetical protein